MSILVKPFKYWLLPSVKKFVYTIFCGRLVWSRPSPYQFFWGRGFPPLKWLLIYRLSSGQCKHWITSPTHYPSANRARRYNFNFRNLVQGTKWYKMFEGICIDLFNLGLLRVNLLGLMTSLFWCLHMYIKMICHKHRMSPINEIFWEKKREYLVNILRQYFCTN